MNFIEKKGRILAVDRRFFPGTLATLLTLAATLSACTPHTYQYALCRIGYVGEAPMLRLNDRLVVSATSASVPLPLLLDTGGAVGLMAAGHAQLWGLKPVAGGQGAAPSISGIGGSRTGRFMVSDTVWLGGLPLWHIPFLVPAESPMRVTSTLPDTLGMNAFNGLDVDVDQLGRRLIFYRTAGDCDSPHVALKGPLYSLPYIYAPPENRPIITATVSGQALRAVLDSGAPRSFLFAGGARRLGLSVSMPGAEAHVTVHGVGPAAVEAVRHLSAPIDVGGVGIQNLRLEVSGAEDAQVDLILGMDFLSHVHLWISNSSRHVVLQFPAGDSPNGGVLVN